MAIQHSIDRATFLANLRQSGLVSAESLTAVANRLPASNRGRVLARALVEQGVLTKFQAERLLAGRSSGFVLGQYRILDELGKGGMGRVFKAVHQTMNRVVALKVLAPQLLDTVKAQQLFLREMRAVAQLMHPNVVTAYDANQVANRYYLVMEYVDGPNLDRLVRDCGPLPPGLACELMRQAAHGLHYALEMGMVHRDIKPSNLLVQLPNDETRRKACTLKILDFGLARLQTGGESAPAEKSTIVARANIVMGTPDFVSPEQARDVHAADIRSDLYSLGCTFYYLLTGRVPFPGGTTIQKLIQHGTEQPVAIDQLRPEVPPEVVAIVRRLMEKDPRARFQTPAELATALGPFAAPGPIPWVDPQTEGEARLASKPTSEDPVPTPAPLPDLAAEFPVWGPMSDEVAALVSTLPPDLSPTPLAETEFPATSGTSGLTQEEQRRAKLAIAIATGIVGGLLALLSLLCLL